MGILGANYPTRTSSSSSLASTTVVAKKSYKVNFVSNTGTKSDVYTGGSTTVKSTYQIPKKSTASASTISTTNTSLQKSSTTSTSTVRRTTLQNCVPCGYGKK